MKYPSISFVPQYSFRVLLLAIFLVGMFAGSLNAQETLFTHEQVTALEQVETRHLIFERRMRDIGTYSVTSPLTKGWSKQIGSQGQKIYLPELDYQIPKDMTLRVRESSIRFARSGLSFSGRQEIREVKANGLLVEIEIPESQVVSVPNDKFKRSFEGFLQPRRFPDNEKKIETETDDDDPPPKVPPQDRFHWRPAINQSLMVLGIQHGYALVAQPKTREALANGNFFTDYWRSVQGLRGWDDGNRFFTNYIAHPMQGGLTGFIFVQNHDRAKRQKFADSKQYWKDRFKAFVWSTAWSTQFELGPISQSSIGNVGKYGHMGYVDLVLTPTVGTAWLISEEAIDRYIIRHIETHSLPFRALVRMFLNPMRSVANMLRLREPWYRDRGGF